MAGPYYSNLRAQERAARTGISNGILNGDDKSGLILKATAIYTLLGTEADGEIIELVDLPAGCVICEDLCSTGLSADPGTTLTVHYGDDGSGGKDTPDPDRYGASSVLGAGGRVAWDSAGRPANAANPYRTTGPCKVRITIVSANTLTAGVKLTCNIYYRIKG